MPESKGRGRPKSRPAQEPAEERPPGPSPRWLVPVMLTCFIVGLLWIVAYYMVPNAPFMEPLGAWNLAVGFGFILVGLFLSTRWR